MASVLKLSPPLGAMKFYYNVSAKVGPYAARACVNNPTDVELVNLLLSIAYPPKTWPQKMTSGTIRRGSALDSASCFLIYSLQDASDEAGGFTKNERPDGVISPGSMTGGYGAGTIYTIAKLNYDARKFDQNAWQRLWEQPGISPMLRAQITHSYT